jgi:formamidopyrimidine-DNA glycosylase
MPEGPECRKIGLQLAKRVSERKLLDIKILSGRYESQGFPTGFEKFMEWTPIGIHGAGVHGKFLFFLLEGEWSIWSTLGMSGTWTNDKNKHSRVEFVMNDGSIFFTDTRNFGTLKFVRGKQLIIDKLESLGPDLLAEEIDDWKFAERLQNKNEKTIAQALMDQSIVSGIGNYVKAEALYNAKISPHRIVRSLDMEEITALNKAVRGVLVESFESGGATIKTYADMNGKIGKFSQRFAVYGQKNDPDGNDVIKEKTKDGRMTHWVPAVQK